MDFTLAALKLFCFQLKHAATTLSPDTMALYDILFQRAWLQGVLVSVSPPEEGGEQRMVLDDGTGVVELLLAKNFLDQEWEVGMYVMVSGLFTARGDDVPLIKVHKIVDLSSYPDREALWHLEVIEANNLYYDTKSEKLIRERLSRASS